MNISGASPFACKTNGNMSNIPGLLLGGVQPSLRQTYYQVITVEFM